MDAVVRSIGRVVDLARGDLAALSAGHAVLPPHPSLVFSPLRSLALSLIRVPVAKQSEHGACDDFEVQPQ